MPLRLRISFIASIPVFSLLASCDYFSTESQLLRKVNGIYGSDVNCTFVSSGEMAPEGKKRPVLTVVDYFQADGIYCGMKDIKRHESGFVLEGNNCVTNHKIVSEAVTEFEEADNISIWVKAVSEDVVRFKIIGGTERTVYRCDQ
jgi:hypothetical protein